ncbi:MAG: UvrD-helicase domain-containing protein [Clostridia bacterium]|nr:UvrD-helicase domain-containing protein [Clostridia bacterium]
MGIAYKPEQQAVIDCQNKNQLVSASAGSGKTTIMIQKIINMITTGGVGIKNILVLTYTKASAEEMKQKLVNAIYGEVKNNPALFAQIDNVETADISTIHSFFQKVIKRYFMLLDINPAFDIIDETRGIKLQNRALDKAIQEFEKTNPAEFATLLDIYGANRTTAGVKTLVKELNRFLLAVPDAKNWCENTMLLLCQNLDHNLGLKILNDEIYFVSKHYENAFKNLAQTAANLGEDKCVAHCAGYINMLSTIQPQPEKFFLNCNIWQNPPKGRLVKNKELEDLNEKLDATKKGFSKFAKKIKGWAFADKKVCEQQLATIAKNAMALCKITLLFQECYANEKRSENVLDYDDLEKYMLKLIDDPKICDEIRQNYEKIFVDEYQDANRVQEKIISAIAKPNNRFMVGDVKQSIYGFRQAEPDIFLETLQDFSTGGQSEVGFLNYNFRSHMLILNFVNFVFSRIMTPATSKIDYAETSMFKWDNVYKEIENQNLPTVEINIIQKPEKPESPQPTKMYSVLDNVDQEKTYTDAQLEAFFVASKIESILGKKIFVAKEKIEREITYKDITILLRSRGAYLDEFCAVITGLGIPLFANTNNSLFADSDVLLLQSILKLSINFCDDIALCAVMKSPFGNFSLNDLVKIRLAGASKAPFWKCVQDYDFDDAIKSKIVALQKFLEDFKTTCMYCGLNKAFSMVLDKSNFWAYLLKKPGGIQKKEKVQKYLNDFLANGYNFDPLGFLEFALNNKDDIKSPDYMGGENCVSITTMHSSKGLEYPVVILANANQDFNKMPVASEIKLNQKYGCGLKFYNTENRTVQTSLPFEAIKKANKNDDFAEKLRLLYVALTRPQNHLIIVGTTPILDFETFSSDYQITAQKSYLSLMVNCLPRHEIEKINAGENVANKEYSVNVISGDFEKSFMEKSAKISGVPNQAVMNEMNKYFNYCTQTISAPLYNSVSTLRKKFENITLASDQQSVEINNRDIGTQFHKALELANFEKIQTLKDAQMFLEKIPDINLVDAGKLLDVIQLIKSLGKFDYAKELPFSMRQKLCEIDKTFTTDEIVVNGIIDLVCLGDENILIDYKYTTEKNIQKIVETYKLQLELYQKALEKSGKIKIDKKYLLLLSTSELVEIK